MSSAIRSIANYNAHQRPTVGDTKTSVVSVDHIGWIKCDGRQLSTSEFSALFSVLGYSFGGSGSSFALPDPQGRVPGFVGQTAGTSDWALGDASGAETHTLTIAEMPSHNHGVAAGGQIAENNQTSVNGLHSHTHNANGPTGYGLVYQNGQDTYQGETDASAEPNLFTASTALSIDASGAHTHTLNPAGGDQPHNNMQPTLFLGNLFIYSGKPRVGSHPTYNAFPPTYSATRTSRIY
jgi:microcystin-dependent protein